MKHASTARSLPSCRSIHCRIKRSFIVGKGPSHRPFLLRILGTFIVGRQELNEPRAVHNHRNGGETWPPVWASLPVHTLFERPLRAVQELLGRWEWHWGFTTQNSIGVVSGR